MTQDMGIKTSSGNVFADLGFPNPDEMLVKAELARQISHAINARNITQSEVADLLGINQPKVSALMRGKLTEFSVEIMFRFLNAIGRDVAIYSKTSVK